jgi:hypothetical protein
MSADKIGTKIEGQKMSQGGSTFDQTTLMVPVVGVGLLVILMAVFYVYYKRKQNKHRPVKRQRVEQRAEKLSRSGRSRGKTLAEAGGLPPVRNPGKEVAP